MSAIQLLQLVSQGLFLLVFVIVMIQVVRRPRRATFDTALLFGAISIIVVLSWVAEAMHTRLSTPFSITTSVALLAIPYLLLRLVDDFTVVPRALRWCAGAGLLLSIASLLLYTTALPRVIVLLYIVYFVGLILYCALSIIGAARHARGVTRRRMFAMALGSVCVGLVILLVVPQLAFPALAIWWGVLSSIASLGAGVSYFLGFTPPLWLRRGWQEPELRAFLATAVHLPRLPDRRTVVRELEHGVATALGASHASISLWDEAAGVLRTEINGAFLENHSGEGIGGRVFTRQRPYFSENTMRDDPARAETYRFYGAHSLLSVPLSLGATRLGILSVYSNRPSIFADDDLQLAGVLGAQIAVVLESQTLIEEATRVQAREEATRMKDDFLSAAAHELKTPLTALLIQAQFIERRARQDPAAPAELARLQRLVHEAERLRQFVLDLLDVTRLAHGRLVHQVELVELVALAMDACGRHSTARHPCLVDGPVPVWGRFDGARLRQLLDNLLENAVTYSPAGGEVCVRVWAEQEEGHLTVTDQGIGIAPTDIPHLFERFHRGSNVDDRRFAGLGLGLFISQNIVEQHGGRIWATSPGVGKGCTFHVALPLSASTPGNNLVVDSPDMALSASRRDVSTP